MAVLTDWAARWRAACRPGTTDWPRKNKITGEFERADAFMGGNAWFMIHARQLEAEQIEARAGLWGSVRWLLWAAEADYKIKYNPQYRSHAIFRSEGWSQLPQYAKVGVCYLDLGEPGVLCVERVNESGTWAAGALETYDSMEATLRGEGWGFDRRADPDGTLYSADEQRDEPRTGRRTGRMAESASTDPTKCKFCLRPISLPAGIKDLGMHWHTETGMFGCNRA